MTRFALMVLLIALAGVGSAAASAEAFSLRYFGYFAARLTVAGGDHLPEVAGRSNLNWVQISDPDRYRPEVLDHCAPAGCIVSTGNEFFRNCTGVHNPECELYPDYVARWSRLAESIRSRMDKVGAFYLLDEPQWRGATLADLETAARTIKATYPTIPVMMVEAGPQVTSALRVPTAVDWVGFDWYCQPFATIESKLATLTTRLSLAQSIFLLPEAAPLQACGGAAGHATDAEIARLQYQYFDLALRNPRVIGLLAFGFWTSGYESAKLPLTVAAHEEIWAQLWTQIAPPTPPPTVTVPPGGPPPTPQTERPVRILSEAIEIGRRGPLAIRLGCPKANAAPCVGRLFLRLPHRDHGGLGTEGFHLDPGRRDHITIGVTRRLRRRLLRFARSKSGARIRVRAITDAGDMTRLLDLRVTASAHRTSIRPRRK